MTNLFVHEIALDWQSHIQLLKLLAMYPDVDQHTLLSLALDKLYSDCTKPSLQIASEQVTG